MEMVLVRLTAPGSRAAHAVVSDEAIGILWAAALPTDRLEHITARPGPRAPDIDLALFHRSRCPGEPEAEAVGHMSLRLCRRAIERSPVLAGWVALLLPIPSARTRHMGPDP